MSVVCDIFQIVLYLIADPPPLYGVHHIQISRGDQHDLKRSVHIKVWQQILLIYALRLRCLYGMDQCIRDLLIRFALQKYPDA